MITSEVKTKALAMWSYLKSHQDTPVSTLAARYNLSPDNISKLVLLQTMGSRDGFIEAYNLMVEGT